MDARVAKQDTEITLGTAKLLGIFFVLVAICAVFFTMGYLLGRNSSRAAASVVVPAPSGNSNPANKPSAGGGKTSLDSQSAAVTRTSDSSASNNSDAQVPVFSAASPSTDASATPAADAPQTKPVQTVSYMVQVAAVSKQEDADILVNALRKKEYPVFVVSNSPGDAFFHVQVGPFSDRKDADAMRSRLAADGYNAIVK